jgi:hypothetical protein
MPVNRVSLARHSNRKIQCQCGLHICTQRLKAQRLSVVPPQRGSGATLKQAHNPSSAPGNAESPFRTPSDRHAQMMPSAARFKASLLGAQPIQRSRERRVPERLQIGMPASAMAKNPACRLNVSHHGAHQLGRNASRVDHMRKRSCRHRWQLVTTPESPEAKRRPTTARLGSYTEAGAQPIQRSRKRGVSLQNAFR